MNFFAAQDRAHRMSRRLIYAYILATVLIVAGITVVVGVALYGLSDTGYQVPVAVFAHQQASVLIGTAVAASLLILGATAYKTAVLSSGGSQVAAGLGGSPVPADTQDPLRRRLRNVVEEIAIASGTPVPDIYVLEMESAINAFAAGYEPGDAAIAVTRGALELLDRAELQGVIAHEFSHILNGDMRLNIRLMGVLFGIMVLGLVGRMILRGGHYGAFAARGRNKGAPAILMVGLGMTVIGFAGVLFARIIKAGVSRQREYLADASAVQFTRQTTGIAGALKKIGGYTQHSYLTAADPEEVSHMLFGAGSRLYGLFATHPPLTDRIRALDPGFDPSDYPDIDLSQSPATRNEPSGISSGIAAAAPVRLQPEQIPELVGRPDDAHLAHAGVLRRSLPRLLYDAAHSPELSYLLVIALLIDHSEKTLDRQLVLVEQQIGRERTGLVRQFFASLQEVGAQYRLPLLEILLPALRRRPRQQLDYLIQLVATLIALDGETDLYEYCFYRILTSALEQAMHPNRKRQRRTLAREPVRQAAVHLLRVLAQHGHSGDERRRRAFEAGLATFGEWGRRFHWQPDSDFSVRALDECLDTLLALNGEGRQMLLKAVMTTTMSDNRMSLAEAELIRAICATLECPLPPILAES